MTQPHAHRWRVAETTGPDHRFPSVCTDCGAEKSFSPDAVTFGAVRRFSVQDKKPQAPAPSGMATIHIRKPRPESARRGGERGAAGRAATLAKRPSVEPLPIPVHGTAGSYSYHGCRCDTCRDGWRVYQKALREQRERREVGEAS